MFDSPVFLFCSVVRGLVPILLEILLFSSTKSLCLLVLQCGRVLSVSRDQTCKMYSIASGQLLLSVSFPTPLLSVTMDAAGQDIYAGDGT